MSEIVNDLFLRALALEPTARVPVWVMRQAGRYLPEYRATRQQAGSFMQLCRSPELAAQVTLQPIDRFDLDAAIVFSDILTIPDGFGLGLDFAEGQGPWLESPVRDAAAIDALPEFDPATIRYVADAVSACKQALASRVPLIGFAGAPFTLACYMVDGKGGEFPEARKLLATEPELFTELLDKITDAVVKSLLLQDDAGADVLMIFDSWAGLVADEYVATCLAQPLQQIMSSLRGQECTKPVISFWRNANQYAEQAVATGVNCLGVDWQTDLGDMSKNYGSKVALQGNLDPAVMLTDPDTIRSKVKECLDSYQGPSGHIFNLGHGINKESPPEHMQVLVDAVKEFSGRK